MSVAQAKKQYTYPKIWILLDYVGVVFFLALTISGLYWVFSDPFISSGWGGLFVSAVGSLGTATFVFEKHNRVTIIVNDNEIIALKSKKEVHIKWSEIDRVYYSLFRGRYADQPVFSLYIFSKEKDFIKITQNIENYFELMELIVRRSPRAQAEPISLVRLLRMLYGAYFARGPEKKEKRG